MRCPYCSHIETQVKDSRASDDGSTIRRRRICSGCGSRFTTFERVQLRDLTVIKNDGSERPFDREKLIRSLRLPCQKRPITQERIEQIANGIQRNLEASGEQNISTSQIGDLVLEALETLDKVAYIRFASVYKDFKSLEDFQKMLTKQKASKPIKKESLF
ncbi:MAG: transcriptional repressor NrdR [Alphaproteobacteria bacterium]|nr:transcriptional repressor NrdR [Alphaproteobacteria bacterium]